QSDQVRLHRVGESARCTIGRESVYAPPLRLPATTSEPGGTFSSAQGGKFSTAGNTGRFRGGWRREEHDRRGLLGLGSLASGCGPAQMPRGGALRPAMERSACRNSARRGSERCSWTYVLRAWRVSLAGRRKIQLLSRSG